MPWAVLLSPIRSLLGGLHPSFHGPNERPSSAAIGEHNNMTLLMLKKAGNKLLTLPNFVQFPQTTVDNIMKRRSGNSTVNDHPKTSTSQMSSRMNFSVDCPGSSPSLTRQQMTCPP
ncbi:hypothetical protein B0T24DRAFT_598139 [Lasiosphaeria ovina]|uniref:Uncharacterized protein n=1 Tax=Lasiosphaeria ovina TaxID=92902 RepID=A0AAE0JVG5_9PEZI|nr:hypothetical protein B0T24DRAFT_598139 [Lasiosphaeria ovina]